MAKTLAELLQAARARIHEISYDELDELIENHEDLLIVDVREREEHAQGHIPGALLVPRGILEAAADPASKHGIERLARARHDAVVLYCDDGTRSALAADTLTQMGFERVYSLAGGLTRWRPEGLVVIAD